jgi:hypothetical protein
VVVASARLNIYLCWKRTYSRSVEMGAILRVCFDFRAAIGGKGRHVYRLLHNVLHLTCVVTNREYFSLNDVTQQLDKSV